MNFLRLGIVGLSRQGDVLGVAVTSTGKAAKADAAYIDPGKTLRQAGHLMRELGVAALAVRAENGEVSGTISRDMVVRSIAAGGDPKTVTVGEVASAGWLIAARRPARPAPGSRGAIMAATRSATR
jgi:signal-transduction protein with cAMP-binding, CBS, and nucleotidyltransferase domain